MEFSVDEIVRLVTLAGFCNIRVKGIWLCYDRRSERYLPLDPDIDQIDLDTNERITKAKEHPEDSFIWWLEARKNSSRKPDNKKISSMSKKIYNREFKRNLDRVFSQVGTIDFRGNTGLIASIPNQAGVLRHGPYVPLKPGNYSARFLIGIPNVLGDISFDENLITLELKVTALSSNRALAEKRLLIKDIQNISKHAQAKNYHFENVELNFSISEVAFGVEFTVITYGNFDIVMEADVELIRVE
jgi:hypothetical protein